MTQTFLDSWISYKASVLYRGTTPPNPSKYYLCLANSSLPTRASLKADFIAAELPQLNGYARQPVIWTADGTFSNANKRHDMPQNTLTYQASGATLQFQTYFLLADGTATASKAVTSADVNAATDTVTVTAHGLIDGDQIMISADPGSTLPGGLSSDTLYNVYGTTTNTFQIWAVDGVAPIDLSNAGSGTFILKYATGRMVALEVRSSAATLQPNQSLTYTLNLAEMNVAYGSGV